ncbi:MAG: PadR family transcriptional regulator [Candidatus Bipolaricaulota bacterium]|nr:PadR family transcriptional regulator [Candidatus Bipolaricaulota bacterium]MDW8126797.1 PadR family transcriptional regulator [Candidatus Bipolaricaulota bacterium]
MVGRGFLRYWVLRLLSEGPRTGYALAKELEERLGWRPSPGSLYPLLGALAEQGLIEHGGEKRPLWRLSQKGEEALAEMEKGKDEWKTLVNLVIQTTKTIPSFSQFLRLFAQAVVSGKTPELEDLLTQINAKLMVLVGGEKDGSCMR